MATKRVDRAPVTRDRIVTRALAIVDAEGLEALSMRRLASDLGVEAASLYHHVRNKDEVLDGIVGLVRSELRLEPPFPDDWIDLLVLIFARYYTVLVAHPHTISLAGRHVDTDEADGLPFILAQGFSIDDAVAAWQSVVSFVIGYAAMSTRQIPGDSDYLPSALAERMTRWPTETVERTVRAILEAYAAAGSNALKVQPSGG